MGRVNGSAERLYIVTDPSGRYVHFEPSRDAVNLKPYSLRLLSDQSPFVAAAKDLAVVEPLVEIPGRIYFGLRVPMQELIALAGSHHQRLIVSVSVIRRAIHALADPYIYPAVIENRARGSREGSNR